ncbi:MAG: ISLre2 family transposase [Bacillota bacterium]
MSYSRRGYRQRGRKRGKCVYLLDELLGIKEGERFCPLIQEIGVELAVETSFRVAAKFMEEYLGVPVSAETVHEWVQAAGEAREKELAEEERRVFEFGEVPEGSKEASFVVIEANGVRVRAQRAKEKAVELKLGVMHEGWKSESAAGGREKLVGKQCWAGHMSEERFWERGSYILPKTYRQFGEVVVNGDGEEWIKGASEYIEGAKVYLDRFHRNRAINQALGFDPRLREKALEEASAGNFEGLMRLIAEAKLKAPSGVHLERVRDLEGYQRRNRDGLKGWHCGQNGLDPIESQVSHVLARRMKRRGMSWSQAGAHNRVVGEVRAIQVAEADGGQGGTGEEGVIEPLAKEDPASWLKASMPILHSYKCSYPIGQVLKALGSLDRLIA